LIEAFGNTKCAIAAYNCGPNRVGEWLDSKVYSVDGVNLDNIPYAETRKYVEKVLKSYEMYNKIYKNYN
jgi:soluble lytic murein transglycosylase